MIASVVSVDARLFFFFNVPDRVVQCLADLTVGIVCYARVFVRLCVAVFLKVARRWKKAVLQTIFVVFGTQIQTVPKLSTDDDSISVNVQNFSLWFPCDFQWENTIRIRLPGTKTTTSVNDWNLKLPSPPANKYINSSQLEPRVREQYWVDTRFAHTESVNGVPFIKWHRL